MTDKINWSERIGTFTKDMRDWPEKSITGLAYSRTQSTVTIATGHFVVLDQFLIASTRDALIEEAKSSLSTPPRRKINDEPA